VSHLVAADPSENSIPALFPAVFAFFAAAAEDLSGQDNAP
jgi:hypothetical protein